MSLIQIVPRLPPPDEGVGNYALALAAVLRDRLGIETRFVVGDPAWPGSPQLGGAAAKVAARRAEDLAKLLDQPLLDQQTVVLHYAGYGYQKRGCPAWLVEGLRLWQRNGGRRLITIFHEVYAGGPPWRSSFWTSPLQRRLAALLAGRSATMVTSLDLYRRLLLPWAGGREINREIRVLPVFSTVGEPAAVPPYAARAPRMAVFGGSGVRARAYGGHRRALASACRALGIEEILDIGPPVAEPLDSVGGIPVRRLGVLPAAEVSARLLDARAGFAAYPPAFLPKSTIHAAYCAHGVLPVCAWQGEIDLPESSAAAAASAAEAHAWYAEHSLPRQAAVWQELLTA